MENPIIGIVLPCYNEELVLEETTTRIQEIISNLIVKNLISNNLTNS